MKERKKGRKKGRKEGRKEGMRKLRKISKGRKDMKHSKPRTSNKKSLFFPQRKKKSQKSIKSILS
jgi:hypothetical protein